jgi:hypothetical protein
MGATRDSLPDLERGRMLWHPPVPVGPGPHPVSAHPSIDRSAHAPSRLQPRAFAMSATCPSVHQAFATHLLEDANNIRAVPERLKHPM